eukprot:scaffold6827_cov55-Phaeocystis_antarctica.AAC.5
MACMAVTLDVSKRSGWLNANVCCRVERRACGWRARGGPDSRLGGGTRGAHPEHGDHVRDLGRVEAERLVELDRDLPGRKAGVRCGKRCGPGGVRALGGGDACGGTRGAHVEHAVHVSNAGRVEAERLVERPRVLPSRKVGMRRGKRGPGNVRELVAATQAACARGGPDSRLWGPGHAWSAPRTCRPWS